MAPHLLAKLKMQGLKSFFCSLVAGKTSPFMVAPVGAELGLGQIGLGLMQPVGRAVHPPMMPLATGFTTGLGRGWGLGVARDLGLTARRSGGRPIQLLQKGDHGLSGCDRLGGVSAIEQL
jgi:hypothetical protein